MADKSAPKKQKLSEDDNLLAALPNEVWAIVAQHISKFPEARQTWLKLRLVSHELSHKATFQLVQLSISRHKELLERARDAISVKASRGDYNEVEATAKFEQSMELERRSELISKALEDHKARERLVDSLSSLVVTPEQRLLLVNPTFLTFLLLTSHTLERSIESFVHIQPRRNYPPYGYPPPQVGPRPSPYPHPFPPDVPEPPFPFGPGLPHPFAPAPPFPNPDIEPRPGFEGDFDRDLNPIPPGMMPFHPGWPRRGGGHGPRGPGFPRII